MKKLLSIIGFSLVSIVSSAQYRNHDSNRIGINIGVNQFTLNTSDFNTSPAIGWNAGLSMRGNFYNNWDMVYGIQFSENNFTVETLNALAMQEDVKFKLSSAQVSLLLSYRFIENHLSVEFGPMFQLNGKLTLPSEDENNIVSETLLTADELTEISNFSFYPTIGITAGITHLRLNITYQYGVSNILGKFDGPESSDFKGHAGLLAGNLIIYL